jgi:predicted metal-dependent hydrolase
MAGPSPERIDCPTPGCGVVFVPSARARRYRLTLRPDGTAVATVPAGGSLAEAERFVAAHRSWLQRARERQGSRPRHPTVWRPGTPVLWRGELTELKLVAVGEPATIAGGVAWPAVCLAADVFLLRTAEGDLRPALEWHFARRAKNELLARTWELAAQTRAPVILVTVRNQRSRWGSCSARGTISLNWRLLQVPESVRDYVILHELAHLREMNHSNRFWTRVEEICPGWREAERWLKAHGSLIGRGGSG